jgi:hypothetical protein
MMTNIIYCNEDSCWYLIYWSINPIVPVKGCCRLFIKYAIPLLCMIFSVIVWCMLKMCRFPCTGNGFCRILKYPKSRIISKTSWEESVAGDQRQGSNPWRPTWVIIKFTRRFLGRRLVAFSLNISEYFVTVSMRPAGPKPWSDRYLAGPTDVVFYSKCKKMVSTYSCQVLGPCMRVCKTKVLVVLVVGPRKRCLWGMRTCLFVWGSARLNL